MTQQQLDWLADAVIPALLCIFLARGIAKFAEPRQAVEFFIRSAAALLVTFLLAHINHWYPLWRDHRGFPSGHMTFYLSVATSFFLMDRRSAWFTLPIAVLYGWLIVFLAYHTWLDLLGAFILSIPVTWMCHRVARRSGNPRSA